MLSWIFASWADVWSPFNVFRYITFRSGMAALMGSLIVLYAGPKFINWARSKQFGQAIRDYGPKSHLKKQGTPSMGGVMILIGLILGTLLCAQPGNPYMWALMGLTLSYGLLGFYDDYIKVVKKDPEGIRSRTKFVIQLIVALFVSTSLYFSHQQVGLEGKIYFPFFKDFSVDLGYFQILFSTLVIVGSSNAVNLTDGLDGLAIGPSIICAAAFFLLCYLGGNAVFSSYLQIPYVRGLGELSVLCAAFLGAGVAFLWFNTYPAQIFMGDVGSLSLGGLLGGLAVASKNEFLLVILGGIFVIETLSVIIQVAYFKMTGKRVFRMAPIHHHFELKGWPEPKVIVRFWIIAFVFAVFALSTLKLR